MSLLSQKPTFSIFTHSVGYHTASHSLLSKLASIAASGITAVELFIDDLWAFSQSDEFVSTQPTALLTPPDSPLLSTSLSASSSKTAVADNHESYNAFGRCTNEEAERELAAAHYLKSFCDELGLSIVCLQPMRNIEGHLCAEQRDLAIKRVESRFPILRALGCPLLLVCSSFSPPASASYRTTTGALSTLVRDFTLLSDLAQAYTQATGFEVRIGYEALSWGTHVNLWCEAWQVVQHTDRENVGLVLDSFNTLAREFADPCTPSFIQQPPDTTLFHLSHSLECLAQQVDGNKVFLLQIGDAERMAAPLDSEDEVKDPAKPNRMVWSRSSRLYPCEEARGGFMPVEEFVRAAMRTGYKGPWSIEVFNDSLAEKGDKVVELHAKRAFQGLQNLYRRLSLPCNSQY